MSANVEELAADETQAGPSATNVPQNEPVSFPVLPTHNPVVDIANRIGPRGETYEEEYKNLMTYLKRTGDVLGPAAPVIFVNTVRTLYRFATDVANDKDLRPYNKCVLLFRIFDAVLLAYKNIGFVYCDVTGARSVYGYSESLLKTMLSRVETVASKVALAVHDTYSLTVLNEVVASTEQRLSQVQSVKDMSEFFRAMSGGAGDIVPMDSVARAANNTQLPHGIEKYKDPYSDVDILLHRLYQYISNNDYVRDLHDAVYILATANSPNMLSSALETRLADKDRSIVLLEVPGDRSFASTLCASAIAHLRKTLNMSKATAGGEVNERSNHIETYRINYGRIFSKYRGESERNFSQMMEWIKDKVRAGDRFRVFWFPDIENMMAPRNSGDQEHIATIKNAMLQHMDDFNKDKTLRSFLLLFNSSEGALDSAFSRRLETVVRTPTRPLRDIAVARQAVEAELAHYHINLSDETAVRLATLVATGSDGGEDRHEEKLVGGYAYVQATLRDMYVNQKLALKYGALSVDVMHMSEELTSSVFGRYLSSENLENNGARFNVLYDLHGRAIKDVTMITKVAFSKASRFSSYFDTRQTVPIKYNSSVHGDPKDITERDAAQIVFLHNL